MFVTELGTQPTKKKKKEPFLGWNAIMHVAVLQIDT